jgi:hypothetical protein
LSAQEPRQKIAVKPPFVRDAQRLARLPFLIHGDKHGKLLVCVASDNLFHMLQHLLRTGWVLLAVYAKTRCGAFIASLSECMVRRRIASEN